MLLRAHARPCIAPRNRVASSRCRTTPLLARASFKPVSAEQQETGAAKEDDDDDARRSTSSRRSNLLCLLGATTSTLVFSSASSSSSFALPAVAASSSSSSSIVPPATIFVVGATGETGKRTVAALVAAGYRVRAGARNRAKAEEALLQPSSSSNKIEIVDLDLETMSVPELAQAIGEETSAVVCCVGSRPRSPLDKKTAAAVDGAGTINLIKAARSHAKTAKFVLLSSILTNGKAIGQGNNPAFIFLELFSGGVLSRKLAAENVLRESGFDSWSVVRPGGLASKTPEELGAGGVFLSGEDTIFGENEQHGAAVSRDAVAEVLVVAVRAEKGNKVVEVVASRNVPTELTGEELDRAWAAV